jgi:hypothetical protein
VELFGSQFFGGGQAGPETLLSPTHYQDAFDTGMGGRFEVFKDFNAVLRAEVGIAYTAWSGKNFTGGEFPSGAKFGDFNLPAFYVGAKAHVFGSETLRPYVVANLGAARPSKVSITTGGVTQPYWSATWTSYLDMGAGVEYHVSRVTALTFDSRLQLFGKPKSANPPISDATGGSAWLFSLGLDIALR